MMVMKGPLKTDVDRNLLKVNLYQRRHSYCLTIREFHVIVGVEGGRGLVGRGRTTR